MTMPLAGVREKYSLAVSKSHSCQVIERGMKEDRANGEVVNGCSQISIS